MGLGPQSIFGAQFGAEQKPKDTSSRTFEVVYIPIDYHPGGKGKGGYGDSYGGGYGYDSYGHGGGKKQKAPKRYKYYLKQ